MKKSMKPPTTPGEIIGTDIVYWGLSLGEERFPSLLIADYKHARMLADLTKAPLVRTYVTIQALDGGSRPRARRALG